MLPPWIEARCGAFAAVTEVHVDSARPLGVRHVLVNGVQDLLLDLGDGVAVQHLHRNLRAVFIVRVHAVQDLSGRQRGEKIRHN